ncbi:MAG: hypothetical protein KME22_09330 [Hassallia sp. WJT32-NPBG1]|jgi:hypothetical protein|nr:hypothetical protein [Hassallia sp. WJT32-NPBG1]
MSIDLDWLNRVGIILNFLAGFMLAPDLIGKERLLIIEEKIEGQLQTIIKLVKSNLKSRYGKRHNYGWIMLIFMSTFFVPGLIVIALDHLNLLVKLPGKMLLYYIIIFFLIPNLLIQQFPRTFRLFLMKSLKQLIKIMNNLEYFLKDDNTIISLLTFWGIIFFIVGNLFQLIASFK